MSERLKLPRVTPEGLVDRKRYLAKHNGLDLVVRCEHSEKFRHLLTFGYVLTCGDTAYLPSDFEWFWGPIPEFELEGE